MTQMHCVDVQEAMPDFASGRTGADRARAVEVHLADCADCAEEFEFVRLLFAGRPGAPEGLADRVVVAVERRRHRSTRPWWGLSAAAVAALAIGIGVSSERGALQSASGLDLASEFEEGELWLSDDGLLAGAPELDALTDEALFQLLEELSSEIGGGSGGTA